MEMKFNLSETFDMEKTKVAIAHLESLLQCSFCKKKAVEPICMRRCDHFFCKSCFNKMKSNTCCECKIVTPSSELKQDKIVANLASCTSDLLALLEGKEIDMTSSGLEAGFGFDRITSDNKENNVAVSTTSTKKKLPVSHTKKSKADTTTQKPEPTTPKQDRTLIREPKTPKTPMVNKRNNKGETVLHSACTKGDMSAIQQLLEDGASPNSKDYAGWTPLHEACSNGYIRIAELLLENGAFVNVPGNENETPLHDAVTNGYVNIVEVLMKYGADKNAMDIWGRTPIDIATKSQNEQMIIALQTKSQPDLNKKDGQVVPQKICILDVNLNTEYKKKAAQVSKILKIRIVNEFSSEVTHGVVMSESNKICRMSAKYLCCVVSGKWVLTHEWLDACLAMGDIADCEPHEIMRSTVETSNGAPRKARLNASVLKPGLFKGCKIYFQGGFENCCFSKKELELLVKAGDGFSLLREPNPESIADNEKTIPFHYKHPGILSNCSHFCIYSEGINEPLLKYDMPHIKSLPLDWLLKCISFFQIVDPR